jgi:perosamine synthetase
MRIPLSAPDITETDIAAVTSVLRTPNLSLGPKLEEFERSVTDYLGIGNAVAVSSGTSGLHLCIRALGIGEGDEVIVPSFAFIAVTNVIRYERAIPVFADVDPEMLNLDPSRIQALITARTKAVLLVHTFGCPAELPEIIDIARRNHLCVIEDSCEAIGAEYDGRKVGTHGDLAVFGFYPNKQITTGEGGMIVTDDSELARSCRILRNQGRSHADEWLQHTELGYNYRISEMNCALGIEQIKRIESILEKRAAIATKYDARLGPCPDVKLPLLAAPRRRLSWFVYVVRLGAEFSRLQRDWIVTTMQSRGIGCAKYFAPIHLQPIYSQFQPRFSLPVTEWNGARSIALPFFNRITDSQIEEVCTNLTELIQLVRGRCQ